MLRSALTKSRKMNEVEPSDINLGVLPMGSDRNLDLHLSNLGMRLAYGSVASDCKWLTLGEARVTDLAEPFDLSLNAVSKHLRVLERAGLLRREVRGREHVLSLEARPLREAAEWIDAYRAFWEHRLDALDAFLRKRRKRHGRKET